MFQDIMLIFFSVTPGQFSGKSVLSSTSEVPFEFFGVQDWSWRLVEYIHDTALVSAIS
jgi:hypothetical protein